MDGGTEREGYVVRAVAIDCDGSLSEHGRPHPALLEAVRSARESGLAVILVTERPLEDYRRDFDADRWFDAIVAHDGTVYALAGQPGQRTSGSGLSRVLDGLRIPRHAVVAIGDALTERARFGDCQRVVAAPDVDFATRTLADLCARQTAA